MEEDAKLIEKEKEENEAEAVAAGRPIKEFDWDNTDEMEKYQFELFKRYKDSKSIMGSLGAMLGDAGDFFSSIFGK